MHLVRSHVDRSIDGPAAFIETNIVGTYTLLEATREYWNKLDSVAKRIFGSIIFPQMRFTAIYTEQMISLLKRHLMHPVVLIQHQKHQVII